MNALTLQGFSNPIIVDEYTTVYPGCINSRNVWVIEHTSVQGKVDYTLYADSPDNMIMTTTYNWNNLKQGLRDFAAGRLG